MTVSLSTITGAAQTGFTSPSFTVTLDVAPDINGKQWAVTAVSGTGLSGVRPHSVSDPFTIMFSRPASPRTLMSPNPTTGKYGPIPNNVYKVVVRKGLNFAANNAPAVGMFKCELSIPAGSDSYDADDVRALLSAAIGALSQVSSGLGDTAVSGIL